MNDYSFFNAPQLKRDPLGRVLAPMKTALASMVLVFVASEPALSQRPVALADSDLSVAAVAYGADSSAVRLVLGRPRSRSMGSWRYDGLRVWFKAGKVRQIALTSRRFHTKRGLGVGDPVARATELYGSSCTDGAYQYCRTLGSDPDERGILLTVTKGRVTDIRIGAVFDLD